MVGKPETHVLIWHLIPVGFHLQNLCVQITSVKNAREGEGRCFSLSIKHFFAACERVVLQRAVYEEGKKRSGAETSMDETVWYRNVLLPSQEQETDFTTASAISGNESLDAPKL